jgi:hypothetical protein
MAVTLLEVQSAIAALAVPGLRRIYTSADAPYEMFDRLCPALIPHPDTPLVESVSTALTIGGVAAQGWLRPRTLAMVCLTTEMGTVSRAGVHGRRLAEIWDTLEGALCDLVFEGLHRVNAVTLSGRFPVYDFSGKPFFGFDVRYSYLTSY